MKPSWTIDVSRATVYDRGQLPDISVVPFDLGGLFGYVSTDGKLLLRDQRLFGLAIDAKTYISFSSVPEELVIRDNGGRVIRSIAASGYPILLDGRLFLISTNRAGLAELAGGQIPRWEREFASVITDLDSRNGFLAVGLLDSRLAVIDEIGTVTLELDMKGSRINAVYGCALSGDAQKVAVIHGIGPQYLSVVDIAGGAAGIIDYGLETEFRTTRYLRFFDSDRFLVVEEKDGLKVLDLDNNDEYAVSSEGSFVSAGAIGSNNLIWVIFAGEAASELVIIHLPGRVVMRTAVAPGVAAFSQDDQILLGIGEILCMAKEEIR